MTRNINANRAAKSLRLRRIACCTSGLALAALGSGHAFGQCAPNPSQPFQTTTCSGTQSGGYTIASNQSPLVVDAGASIVNNGDAVTVSIPATSTYDYRNVAITVNGTIASTGGNGILVNPGLPYQSGYDFAGTYGSITVGAGGSVTGATGIMLTPATGNFSYYTPLNISLDNAGTITGTAGPALATGGSPANFSSIINETTGKLGAVAASFGTLTNQGLIDGGTQAAVNASSTYYYATITNTGTIQAEGAVATISSTSNSINVTNSGTITNLGGGAAVNVNAYGMVINQAGGTISAAGRDVVTGNILTLANTGAIVNTGAGQAVSGNTLNVTNYAGGTVTAGSGGTAINASSALFLTNFGAIDGNVLAGSAASYYQNNTIDSSQGTINGDVTFGIGYNTLVATIVAGAVQTGITGSITGGIGSGTTNTLVIATTADTTLSSSVALPTNFTRLNFNPGSATTLTLGNGFSNPGTIAYNGNGKLVNAAVLTGSGQIVSAGYSAGIFSNTGSIASSNVGGPAAVGLSGNGSLDNSGSITATGAAVSAAGGTVTNSGTITSTGGTALTLSSGYSSANSGTISGALIGVDLSYSSIANTGTITSPGLGIALGYYATVNNQAGGVISGGTYAIGLANGAPGIDTIDNAGTITGDVNLANSGFGTNIYDAAPGGVLDGNLTLGAGDTLITEVKNTGSGAFAGISGTVTANNSNLIYLVRADATVSGAAAAGFSAASFALFNNPTLTLDATTAYTSTLQLAGTGTVDLDGTIATTNAVGVLSSASLPLNFTPPANGLSLINNGSVATTITNPYSGFYEAVVLGYGDKLTNNGTISLTNTGGYTYGAQAAVSGGISVTNAGTITGSGTSAVAIGAYGYATAPQLINSGTLSSDGTTVAIQGAATITNSGTIVTTGQAAIGVPSGYYYGQPGIINLAGGIISGPGDAIELSGGTVSNAGMITGNVNLAYPTFGYPFSGSGAYYDTGGTLNGDLTLNSNEALVIQGVAATTGPLGGVTGTINANGAALVYDVASTATTSASNGAGGFGTTGYLIANDATLTLDAASNLTTTLSVAGSGAVVFDGSIATSNSPALLSQPSTLLTATATATASAAANSALTITNNGTIAATIDATNTAPIVVSLANSDTLVNNGTISLVDANPVTYSAAVSGGQSITNTGTISASNANAAFVGNGYSSLVQTLTNSGTITSNMLALAQGGAATITNSGNITSTGGAAIGLANPYSYYGGISTALTNLAGGVITGVGDAIDLQGGTVSNAGTINGNVNLAYSPYFFFYPSGSYYDQGGTLNGNLTLGYGQALIIDYGAGGNGPLGGVTGTINAGNATLVYNVATDATLTASPAAGFGAVTYQLANDAILTVPSGATLTTTLGVSGQGAVILDGSLATGDQPAFQSVAPFAIGTTPAIATALTITNNGSIATALDNASFTSNAVTLGSADTLINNGTISLTSANPENYNATVNSGQSVTNTGTISGTNANAMIVGNGYSSTGETVINSGTITSNLLAISEGGPATITNSGNIISTGSAAIGGFNPYSSYSGFTDSLTNLAGGVITGLGDAITMQGGIVSNAGTINGDVNLAYSPYGYVGYSQGAYYDNGGTLNGNLTLAGFQALVVDYAAAGNGPLGGVTGTINANGAALFYNVTSNATILTPPAIAGFAAVGYQLTNNAALTLPAGTTLTGTLDLSGQGSLIINGSIVTSDLPAIQSLTPFAIANAPTITAVTITNNGTIAAAIDNDSVYGATTVSLGSGDTLVNNGTISGTKHSSFAEPFTVVFGGLSLTNTGTISGLGVIAVSDGGATLALTNSGTITSDQIAIYVDGPTTIANSGSITSTGSAAISSYYTASPGSTGTALDNLAGGVISGVGDAVDLQGGTFANAGTINGNVNLGYSPYGYPSYQTGAYFNNGGTLNGNLTLGAAQALYTGFGTVDGGKVLGITGSVTPNGAGLVYIVDADASDIGTAPAGFGYQGYQLANNATLTLSPPTTLTTVIGLSGTGAVIFNGAITTAFVPAIISAPVQTIAGISTVPNSLKITNNGTLSTTLPGNIDFNSPLQPSTVFLTSGDMLINAGSIALFNTSGTSLATAAAVYGGAAVINSGTITGIGTDAVVLALPATPGSVAPSLVNSGSIVTDQIAVQTNGAATITNTGSISGRGLAILGLNADTEIINQASGVIAGYKDAIDLPGGLVSNFGTISGNVDLGYAAAGAAANAAPAVYIANGGTLNGNLTFASTGGGNELVETGAALGVSGTIASGPGTNFLGHLRTASGTVALGAPRPTGFAVEYTVASGAATQVTLTGPASSAANIYVGGDGSIVNQANTSGIVTGLAAVGESYYAGQNLQLASFTNQGRIGGIDLATGALINSGTITGNVTLSAASDTLVDAPGGAISGNIVLQPHAGTGSITLAGRFAGNIDGGDGPTSLAVSGGSAAQPAAFGTIANVASYNQTGGYAALSGTGSVGTAMISGGSFIGGVGSILNAAQITVGSGANFASGGTINGNLAVGGTLHVGASPDTMTVNGNVALASGSTSVFEVSPAASSRLVASGTVTIGSGTTLQIVQLQPLMPGTKIDLIDAAGGISGNFTTVSGIDAALLRQGDSLSLVELFDASQPANRQVARGVDYVNALIAAGMASPALLAALPALETASGAPAAAGFGRLTPEPYASAEQIGVENALMLSRSLHDLDFDGGLRSGDLFSFGAALGNWRGLKGDGAAGTSDAHISGHGFIGGLGIGSARASLAAFGGYLDQTQTIGALGASTRAKGFVGGVTGRAASGPLQLNLAVIYDDAHASTQRLSPDARTLTGDYGLHSWTLDGEVAASIAIGDSWAARPHVGATWVWTQRGSTVEDHASAFALTVAGHHHDAGFVEGGVRFDAAKDALRTLSPYVDLGLRYQVTGRAVSAAAGLDGGPVTLLAGGDRRRAASALIEAGARYRINPAVGLFVTGNGDISGHDSSGAISGGVTVRF